MSWSKPAGAAATLVVWACGPDAAWAHGNSDVEGAFAVARDGEAALLQVTLRELEPGVATDARVQARVDGGGATHRIDLSPSGPLQWTGQFPKAAGPHKLRVYVTRDVGRHVAMGGFDGVGAGSAPAGHDLFFEPAGRFDAIPAIDHASGVVGGVALAAASARVAQAGQRTSSGGAPLALLAIAAAGALLTPFGIHWDIATHITAGREGVLSAPHQVMYAGVALSGLAAAAVLALAGRRRGVRAALDDDRALLAVIGGGLLAVSTAPFDELWHVTFGSDASIWSPPHAVGIFALYTLCIALGTVRVDGPAAAVGVLRVLAIAGALHVSEVFMGEYEYPFPAWHVSQDRPAAVLPLVLALSALFGALVARVSVPFRFGGAAVVATWIAMRALAQAGLVVLAMPVVPRLPVWLPALVLVGLAVDVAGRRPTD